MHQVVPQKPTNSSIGFLLYKLDTILLFFFFIIVFQLQRLVDSFLLVAILECFIAVYLTNTTSTIAKLLDIYLGHV